MKRMEENFDLHEQGFYERGFAAISESSSGTNDRDLIASVLLDAVEQSLTSHHREADKARRWLSGIYAQSLLLLLDINPDAALECLNRKWSRTDAGTRTIH